MAVDFTSIVDIIDLAIKLRETYTFLTGVSSSILISSASLTVIYGFLIAGKLDLLNDSSDNDKGSVSFFFTPGKNVCEISPSLLSGGWIFYSLLNIFFYS